MKRLPWAALITTLKLFSAASAIWLEKCFAVAMPTEKAKWRPLTCSIIPSVPYWECTQSETCPVVKLATA